jgi:hypothetical protein
MKTGDNVLYQVNKDKARPAKILQVNGDGSADLMVFVHPNDYPDFSQAECLSGNGHRAGKKEGLKIDDFFYEPTA